MSEPFRAALFDGRRAVPTRGVARVSAGELVLESEGPRQVWPLGAVRDTQLVRGELRVALRGAAGEPDAELVVEDGAAFEAALAGAAERHGDAPGIGARRRWRALGLRAWLLIAAVVVPAAYGIYTALLPRLHVFVSKEREAALGEYVYSAVAQRWDPLADAEFEALATAMVRALSDPLAGYDVRVSLVDEDIPNAFALPGGRVVVFRGLVGACDSPDALAGVLAHELAHVEERHGLRHLMRTLGILAFAGGVVGGSFEGFEAAETAVELSSGLLALRHSRRHEREADRIAVAKLVAAGRSPRGLAQFFEAMQARPGMELADRLAWLSTHPVSSERVAALEAWTAGAPTGEPWLSEEAWAELRTRLGE